MSIEAMKWALDQKSGCPLAKSVLLILANRANEIGECWPGTKSIAIQTEQSERTVIRKIAFLESVGLIEKVPRSGSGKGRKSNLYRLNLRAKCHSDRGGQSDSLTGAKCHSDRGNVTHSQGQSDTLSPEPKEETKVNPKKKPKRGEKFVLPDWLAEEAWSDFVAHRKNIKKPLTELASKKVWNKLAGLSAKQQAEAIDEAIEKNWITVYPKPSESLPDVAEDQRW